jgi:hypothetical protein
MVQGISDSLVNSIVEYTKKEAGKSISQLTDQNQDAVISFLNKNPKILQKIADNIVIKQSGDTYVCEKKSWFRRWTGFGWLRYIFLTPLKEETEFNKIFNNIQEGVANKTIQKNTQSEGVVKLLNAIAQKRINRASICGSQLELISFPKEEPATQPRVPAEERPFVSTPPPARRSSRVQKETPPQLEEHPKEEPAEQSQVPAEERPSVSTPPPARRSIVPETPPQPKEQPKEEPAEPAKKPQPQLKPATVWTHKNQVIQVVIPTTSVKEAALKILPYNAANKSLWEVIRLAKSDIDEGLIMSRQGVRIYDRGEKFVAMVLSGNRYFPEHNYEDISKEDPSEVIPKIKSIIEQYRGTFDGDMKDAPVFDEPAIRLALEGQDPDILACKKIFAEYAEAIERIIG